RVRAPGRQGIHPRVVARYRRGGGLRVAQVVGEPAQSELGLEVGQLPGMARGERFVEAEPARRRALLHRRAVTRQWLLLARIDLDRREVELLDEAARRRQHARTEQHDRIGRDGEAGLLGYLVRRARAQPVLAL